MIRQRRLSAAFVVALVCAALVLSSTFAGSAPPLEDAAGPVRSVAEMVGPTDGYSLVIQSSGDLMGSLETCGCPKRPMGGYAWRTGYTSMLRSATAGRVPIVEVDAGRAFADEIVDNRMPDDVRIKNEWILRSFGMIDIAAINVAHADLVYLSSLLRQGDLKANTRRFPALAALVSANVHAVRRDLAQLKPYVVKTVPAGQRGGRPIRVAFIGVTEKAPKSLEDRVNHGTTGYGISDPVEAVQTVLPEARAKSDLVVVLAYVDRDTAARIGAIVPSPDVVVAAHQYPLFNRTDTSGTATVAYVSTQTKWLAELRFDRPPGAPKPGRPALVAHRDVPLDAQTPSDPDADALVNAARAEFTAIQQEAIAREATGGAAVTLETARAALAEKSDFAGSEACATCHQYQYEVWKGSQHAHAFRTLERKNRHLDAACTVCHVVRQGEPGGFLNTRLTPRLQDVQCEACHGPGKQHVAAPKGGEYGRVAVPAGCVKCHTLENDPDFEFASYWKKIRHDQEE